jgi:hypothetical protein
MMKQILCVAALAYVAVMASESSMSTMPLFVWSGDSDMSAKPQSADAALATALTSGRPELVMAYMFDEVSTFEMQNHQEAFTHLEGAIEDAKSSAFVALPVSKVNIDGLLATARVNGVEGKVVESSELQGYLAAHPELMANSKPDMLIVHFSGTMDAASADAVIGSAEKAVAQSTFGKYVSILSTTSSMMEPGAASNLAFQFFPSDLRSAEHYAFQNGTLAPNNSAMMYGPSFYLTPTLLLAILSMIYMGLLLITAYCCILSLQTPEKFEGDQEKDMNRALGNDK